MREDEEPARCPICRVDYSETRNGDLYCEECGRDPEQAKLEVEDRKDRERRDRERTARVERSDDTRECWAICFGLSGQDLWWRDGARGYTTRIGEAGLFTERRANEQDGRERSGGMDRAVSPQRLREMLARELPRLEAEVARVRETLELLALIESGTL